MNYSCYAEILHEFVAIHNALDVALEASWFMQDDARPHRTPKVFTLLEEYFDNHVIALDYAIGKSKNWSPYSDLKPCNFFPWGHVKDVVYCQHPTLLAELQRLICQYPTLLTELQRLICQACAAIPVETLHKVCANFILRLRQVIVMNGGNFVLCNCQPLPLNAVAATSPVDKIFY